MKKKEFEIDDIFVNPVDDWGTTYSIDTSSTSSLYNTMIGPYPSFNVGAVGSSYTTNSTGFNGTGFSSDLQVKGSANFDGNVTIKGVDLVKLLETIQDRLAILVPDPEKLEKYQALKKAYEHYKLLETLVKED